MQLLVWTFKSTPDIEIGENIVSQGKKTKQQRSMVVGTKLWTTVVCEGTIMWMEQKGICYSL